MVGQAKNCLIHYEFQAGFQLDADYSLPVEMSLCNKRSAGIMSLTCSDA